MKNIHPIIAGLVSQQVLHLAVKTDSSAEFINDLRVNTNNTSLQTENGRNEAFMSSLADEISREGQVQRVGRVTPLIKK